MTPVSLLPDFSNTVETNRKDISPKAQGLGDQSGKPLADVHLVKKKLLP
jgi:hypothetical protein